MTITQELTLPKLKTLVRTTVREELQELLSDPDLGLALTATAKARLFDSQKSKRAGRVVPADELIAHLRSRPK